MAVGYLWISEVVVRCLPLSLSIIKFYLWPLGIFCCAHRLVPNTIVIREDAHPQPNFRQRLRNPAETGRMNCSGQKCQRHLKKTHKIN